jgi:hypothetical protein
LDPPASAECCDQGETTAEIEIELISDDWVAASQVESF